MAALRGEGAELLAPCPVTAERLGRSLQDREVLQSCLPNLDRIEESAKNLRAAAVGAFLRLKLRVAALVQHQLQRLPPREREQLLQDFQALSQPEEVLAEATEGEREAIQAEQRLMRVVSCLLSGAPLSPGEMTEGVRNFDALLRRQIEEERHSLVL